MFLPPPKQRSNFTFVNLIYLLETFKSTLQLNDNG